MLKENKLEGYRDDKSSAGTTNANPIREGQPMGGQNFGKNNNTPAGDDKNNPSQNAGYSNAYFARTEPLEEHPEDTNLKPTTRMASLITAALSLMHRSKANIPTAANPVQIHHILKAPPTMRLKIIKLMV